MWGLCAFYQRLLRVLLDEWIDLDGLVFSAIKFISCLHIESTRTRYNQENIHVQPRFGNGELIVWGGIILSSRTIPYVQKTTKTVTYRDIILKQHVRLFTDDDARRHRATIVNQYLEEEYHPFGMADVIFRSEPD